MSDRPKHSADSTVTDQAASWLLRLRAPECTEDDRARFNAWLQADPTHAREYEDLLEVWALSGELEPTIEPASSEESAERTSDVPVVRPTSS
jgi:transmembrane sensor